VVWGDPRKPSLDMCTVEKMFVYESPRPCSILLTIAANERLPNAKMNASFVCTRRRLYIFRTTTDGESLEISLRDELRNSSNKLQVGTRKDPSRIPLACNTVFNYRNFYERLCRLLRMTLCIHQRLSVDYFLLACLDKWVLNTVSLPASSWHTLNSRSIVCSSIRKASSGPYDKTIRFSNFEQVMCVLYTLVWRCFSLP
jgi:hypothetical protein